MPRLLVCGPPGVKVMGEYGLGFTGLGGPGGHGFHLFLSLNSYSTPKSSTSHACEPGAPVAREPDSGAPKSPSSLSPCSPRSTQKASPLLRKCSLEAEGWAESPKGTVTLLSEPHSGAAPFAVHTRGTAVVGTAKQQVVSGPGSV